VLLALSIAFVQQGRALDRARADTATVGDTLQRLESSFSAEAEQGFDARRVANSLAPSVVTILTPIGLGTGFVVKGDGSESWIATNYHVVSDGQGGVVRRVSAEQNGVRWPATLDRWSSEDDLAMVRVVHVLPVLDILGPADPDPAVGESVMAFGSPEGFQGSATVGVISAVRADWIQTDAQINHGNSGGPLVDSEARVLGITTLGVGSGSGLGFAINARKLCELDPGISDCV